MSLASARADGLRDTSFNPGKGGVLRRRAPGLLVVVMLFAQSGWWQPVWAGDADGKYVVTDSADRLTVRAPDAPLGAVLQEIARQGDLTVNVDPSVMDQPVTAAFDDLSIQEGLEKLLTGYNFAFAFSPHAQGAPALGRRVTDVWVLSKRDETPEERDSGAVEESPRAAPRAESEATSPDPSVRLRAVDALRDRGDPAAVPILMNLLSDQDQEVRLSALDALNNLGVAVPAERIAEIAINHEDPQIRLEAVTSGLPVPNEALVYHALHDHAPAVRVGALEALEGDPRAEAVAREALNDPNRIVQSVAQDILRSLREDSESAQDGGDDSPTSEDEDDMHLSEE